MMKKYYYFDGRKKRGPYTEDKFIKLNLNDETFIWTEGHDNWKPLKEFPDLLKIIPPPLPDNIQPEFKKKKKLKKVKFSFFTLIVLLIVSFIIVYMLIQFKKNKLKVEISDEIERVFNGENTICNGQEFHVYGYLESVIDSMPVRDRYESHWLYEKALDEYFTAKSIEFFSCKVGGFTLKKLTQRPNQKFQLEEYSSNNMAYTSTNYLRGTVQEAYDQAYDYLISENSCYNPSRHHENFTNFWNLENDYYYLCEYTETNPAYLGSNQVIIYGKYTKLYYDYKPSFYKISENDLKIKEDYIKYSSITGGISFLIFLFLLIFNPFKR